MVYFEFQLSGTVRVYEQSDALFLYRLQLLAGAEALPLPANMAEAHDYCRAGCFQLEFFEDFEEAALWVERYGGFRASEARAAFARYRERRAAIIAAEPDTLELVA
jgi:hypothetical protein